MLEHTYGKELLAPYYEQVFVNIEKNSIFAAQNKNNNL